MPFDWHIQRFDTLISTQDTMREKAASGAAEGFVVQAAMQSGGQGRHGREWDSPAGNLYLSVLLRPECEVAVIGQLSLITGAALARVIKRFIDFPEGVQLKWPNDVLLFDKKGAGKKCAGILLESELGLGGQVSHVVIGVGVNVASAPPEIGACLGENIDLDAFRDAFLAELAEVYAAWQKDGFGELRDIWLGLAHQQGQAMSVKIGERLESGDFHDIDALGNLRLAQGGGLKTITSGDVYVTGD